MKALSLAIILSLFCVFTSCKSKAPAKTEKDIRTDQFNQFLNDWHKAASNSDYDSFFDAIAKDGIYVGTDETEVWTKDEFSAFAKPYFDKGKAWDFTVKKRNVYFSPDWKYIWFNETLDTWMGNCRGSGIVVYNQEENNYQIKQYVLSLTVPNKRIRDVIKVIDAN